MALTAAQKSFIEKVGGLVLTDRSHLNTVTPDIQTPAAVGQYQHGSAKWLLEKEKDRVFENFVLDPNDELIKGLIKSGYDGLEFITEKN